MPALPLDLKLRTARCTLGCIDDADLEDVWTATRHPGFNDGMIWEAPASREEIRDWTAKSHALWSAGADYAFSARHSASGAFIGRAVTRPAQPEATWRIGFWVHPRWWNRGYATELAQAMIDLAFGRLGAEAVAAAHAPWNKASARVIAKLGLRFAREIPQGFKKKGAWVPEIEYTLPRSRWSGA